MEMSFVCLGFLDLLKNVFNWIFENTLKPPLEWAFNAVVELTESLLKDVFSAWLLDLLSTLLKIISYIARAFDVFTGIKNVTVGDSGEEMTLLTYLLTRSGVGTVFVGFMGIGFVLVFLFALWATGKNISDSALDAEVQPLSKVLANAMKSAVAFAVIPILCVGLQVLSSGLLRSTYYSLQQSQAESGISTELEADDVIFLAVAQEKANSDAALKYYQEGTRHYYDTDLVKQDFNYHEFNYLAGYVSAILTAVILVIAILGVIMKYFQCLVLYLVAPVFASTIALDGGEKFKGWREAFIGSYFGAFGPVISFELFLMLVPLLTGSTICFFTSGTYASEMNCIVNLIIIVGGAWAVFKGQNTIYQLMFGYTASDGMELVTGLVSNAITKGYNKMQGNGQPRNLRSAGGGPTEGQQMVRHNQLQGGGK